MREQLGGALCDQLAEVLDGAKVGKSEVLQIALRKQVRCCLAAISNLLPQQEQPRALISDLMSSSTGVILR